MKPASWQVRMSGPGLFWGSLPDANVTNSDSLSRAHARYYNRYHHTFLLRTHACQISFESKRFFQSPADCSFWPLNTSTLPWLDASLASTQSQVMNAPQRLDKTLIRLDDGPTWGVVPIKDDSVIRRQIVLKCFFMGKGRALRYFASWVVIAPPPALHQLEQDHLLFKSNGSSTVLMQEKANAEKSKKNNIWHDSNSEMHHKGISSKGRCLERTFSPLVVVLFCLLKIISSSGSRIGEWMCWFVSGGISPKPWIR